MTSVCSYVRKSGAADVFCSKSVKYGSEVEKQPLIEVLCQATRAQNIMEGKYALIREDDVRKIKNWIIVPEYHEGDICSLQWILGINSAIPIVRKALEDLYKARMKGIPL